MFAERLNEICRLMDTPGNTELAAAMACKPTYVSLFRRGKRIPTPGSRAADRLLKGILILADEKQKTDLLYCLTGVAPSAGKAALLPALERYLLSDEKTRPPKKAGRRSNTTAEDAARLGRRLNAAMELLNISGARLSRLADMDASVLSRWRNGIRIPVTDPDALERVSRCLTHHAEARHRLDALSGLTGIPVPELASPSKMPSALAVWLSDPASAGASAIESFLQKISGMPAPVMPPLPEHIPENDTGTRTYRGPAGLQEAVLRFLRTCAAEKAPTLLLYSDQDISWMVRDPDFSRRWASLMAACIRNGSRIRIIHNIDRSLEEMTEAIGSWLPLYMTGQVEGWYCTRECGQRFSHTLFLAPGTALIYNWFAADGRQNALYHYETDPDVLAEYGQVYKDLAAASQPLIRMDFLPPEANAPYYGRQGLWSVRETLPLALMPRDLAERIAARLPEEADRTRFMADWEACRDFYMTGLKTGSVVDFIVLPDERQIKEDRFPVDYLRGTVFCSGREYAAHWRSVLDAAERRPNYRPLLLSKAPFPHVMIQMISGGVTIVRTAPAVTVFTVTHPLMQSAFYAYMEKLRQCSREEQAGCRKTMEALLQELGEDS